MSTKFEQLLDYLVNEEMEKANELFHEIVVEKSRNIYENLISEEEDEEADESREEDDEEMDESMEDDEKMDESMEDDEEMDESHEELEDSYKMDDESEEHDFAAGDATDDFGADVMSGDDEEGHESEEDSAIYDIKNAIADLEAAFAELEQAQGSEEADMGIEHDHDFDDEEETDEMMGTMESRRMTREYVEKVGNDWDKNAQKTQGQYAGANTGESLPSPTEGKSPVSSGKGKPTTGANANNVAQGDGEDGQHNVGTTPNKVNNGITPEKSEQYTGKDWEANSKPGGTAGVKNLKKVGAGYPGNNKTPGPVGSGTGDKAGQTSVSSSKPFLKKL